MIDEGFLKEVVERIVANYEPEQILLFGSQARNSGTSASDIDILVVKNTSLPMWRRGKNIVALFERSRVRLDLLFCTPHEIRDEARRPNSFMSGILATARVLYSRKT
jgi:predicted nucleotidyltransferase